MPEQSRPSFWSGDALFAFDPDLTIVAWNHAAERLTGVSADEALGRRCWEVLGGHDQSGNLVCHAGCSSARLARQGWPVACQGLLVKAHDGKRRRVEVATVTVDDGDRRLFLHVMVPRDAQPLPGPEFLTPRQHEVLRLMADGLPAKTIGLRLGVAEATVRNHIRGILAALDTHSQLQAIAKARRLQIVD